jgi:hypothetical protein
MCSHFFSSIGQRLHRELGEELFDCRPPDLARVFLFVCLPGPSGFPHFGRAGSPPHLRLPAQITGLTSTPRIDGHVDLNRFHAPERRVRGTGTIAFAKIKNLAPAPHPCRIAPSITADRTLHLR